MQVGCGLFYLLGRGKSGIWNYGDRYETPIPPWCSAPHETSHQSRPATSVVVTEPVL